MSQVLAMAKVTHLNDFGGLKVPLLDGWLVQICLEVFNYCHGWLSGSFPVLLGLPPMHSFKDHLGEEVHTSDQ